jgi:16S rRNA (guanine527-N7)-methyltransferase
MVNNLTFQISRRLDLAGCLNAVHIDALSKYVELLVKWNRKINLTSLDIEPLTDEAVDRLIVESVVASQFAPAGKIQILDLGTGGGSPAIPFRIQLPAASLRMVESRSKKCAFLREVVRTLAIANSVVEEARFEDLAEQPRGTQTADLITLRAVRLDRQLIELMRMRLKESGRIFRFVNSADMAGQLPEGLLVVETHPLVSASTLQILKLT